MADNTARIQALLKEKADLTTRLQLIPFDGSIEIKTIQQEKYLYARKRENGKNTSRYLDKYSDERYSLLLRQSLEARSLKKQLRAIEKTLAQLGYSPSILSPRVLLNVEFARTNVKALIYDQAVLEGVATTFPQTETILENGKVNGVTASDVQKILNLKHAWEFILDLDVLASPTNFYLLSYISRLINEGFYDEGGRIRGVPVTIGGTSYVPPLPLESTVKETLQAILDQPLSGIEKAISLCLYCIKAQVFNDGNKRSAVIFSNHFLIREGQGLLVVPENLVSTFKRLLVRYYETSDDHDLSNFLKEKCWRKF